MSAKSNNVISTEAPGSSGFLLLESKNQRGEAEKSFKQVNSKILLFKF
jgi:hypothetical protein